MAAIKHLDFAIVAVLIGAAIWLYDAFDGVGDRIVETSQELKLTKSELERKIQYIEKTTQPVDENAINRNIAKNNLTVSRVERDLSDLKKKYQR